MHCNFQTPRHRILLSDAIKDYINCALKKASDRKEEVSVPSPEQESMIKLTIKIFHKQYKLKKCPSTLKYFPCNVRDQRCRSCMFFSECTSRNSCREISSRAAISNRNWPMSVNEITNKLIKSPLIPPLPLTFCTRWSLSNRTDHSPNSLSRVIRRLVSSPVQCNPFLLAQDHVHRVHQFSFHVYHVRLRDWPNEIRHVCIGIVNGTEAAENGHHSDSDHADPRDCLFEGENSLGHAEQGKRVSDAPKSVEVEDPQNGSQLFDPLLGDWNDEVD